MLLFQRPLRGLLGGAQPGGLISTSTSHIRLRVLEGKLGLDVMKTAIVVKTGNGLQLWFRHDPEGRMRTTAGIRPGIDIRAGHNGKGHMLAWLERTMQ